MKLGQRIKAIRKSRKITQQELAFRSKMSRSYLADVENDRYNPSLTTLEKISEALNVSVDRLAGEAAISIIEDRLEELGLSLEQLSEKAKVPLRFLEQLDEIVPEESDYAHITSIAEALKISPGVLRAAFARQESPSFDGPTRSAREDFTDYLPTPANNLEQNITTDIDFVKLPIVGKISCGNGTYAYSEIEGYEPTPKDWLNGGEYFYTRACGDSMIGARIQDGDLVLIRRQPDVEDGEIAAIQFEDRIYLKRVFKRNGAVILQSENSAYPPQIISNKPGECFIVGKLKKVIINM
ncbi:hypothetical protein P22_2000 [Propionispora sp. 2/2-37]|uniref:XRE family transcriptional regulator n=1 Tax=Propionispora sp. 2/2-37 TaxID=1677858 RepID=UPI0006BB79DF|nr:XRE family transcriptional regulator [Propionispora sp. 2/2-37]CUH95914.1 hypothetical protein P22_2000 [Propionispora sp. 2/2-37]